MARNWRSLEGRLVFLVLASAALANGGCLWIAAGAATGGAVGYAYCKGKVCRMYNANFEDVWAATHTALADLHMPIVGEEREGNSGTLHSRLAEGSRVRIHFDLEHSKIPAEGTVTRVCVRVSTFGDQAVSERLLDQVDMHLTRPGQFMGPPEPPLAPTPATAQTWGQPQKPVETAPPPLAAPEPAPHRVEQ